MKRKARIQTGIDDRLVAIYARKSRITNKGDSIGVQFKQSADYAINQLSPTGRLRICPGMRTKV